MPVTVESKKKIVEIYTKWCHQNLHMKSKNFNSRARCFIYFDAKHLDVYVISND